MADAIRFLDVELDISDCQALYDYDKGEKIERPSEGWNNLTRRELSRRTSLDYVEHNKAFTMRVKLMDRAWKLKEPLEKRFVVHKKGDPEDLNRGAYSNLQEQRDDDDDEGSAFGLHRSFTSDKYLPRRVLPIYNPGDVVKGSVVLELSNPLSAENLTLNLCGQAQVLSLDYYEAYKSDSYIDETLTLWKTSDGVEGISDAFSLLSTNSQVVSRRLPSGLSRFSFEFAIPVRSQGSIPPLAPSEEISANLVYRFKATINIGKMSRPIIRTRAIWVEQPYDISSVPGHMKPITVEEVHKTGILGSTGQVVLRVTIPRRAWVRGEVIPLNIELNNEASKEIAAIKAMVILQCLAKTGTTILDMTCNIKIKGSKCKDGPIPGGVSRQFQWQVPIDFSRSNVDSNLVPVGPLDCFKLLDIQYKVVVKAKRKDLHRDVTLSIPITLGSHNSESQA